MSFVKSVTTLVGASLAAMAIVIPAAAPVAAAASPTTQGNQGGSGLQISPTRSETTINPGDSKPIKITLKNVTAGPVIAKPFVNDFESDNETGQPKIITDTKKHTDFSAAQFISQIADTELDVNQSKDVTVIISVPKGAAPGGYYSAIRFAAVPKDPAKQTDQNTQVSLTASLAHLVLVQINGNITQGLKFDEFNILRKGKASTFFLNPPDQVAVRLSNTGNGFAQPFGKVVINKGSKQVYAYEINNTDPRGNILPKTSRTFKDSIKNISNFGKFTAVSSVTYQQGGEVVTATKTFWVIPAWAVIILVFLIVLIIGAIFFLAGKMRSGRR
jgi:hypothetical protein